MYNIEWVTEDRDENLDDAQLTQLIRKLGYKREGNVIKDKTGDFVGKIVKVCKVAN